MMTAIPMADLLLSALTTNSFKLDENILLSTQTEGHFENWKATQKRKFTPFLSLRKMLPTILEGLQGLKVMNFVNLYL